jgi:hypothetical protein
VAARSRRCADVEDGAVASTCLVRETSLQYPEAPMKYLILIYGNAQSREIWEGFTDAPRADGFGLYAAITDELVASGELIVAEALTDVSQAKRVTARDGRMTSADGPFAEAKEHLAGFFLVDCETQDRALEIAVRLPEARFGLIQVRPVMSLGGSDI